MVYNSYINHYLEENKEKSFIFFGERIRGVLYYIYDDSSNILGFKYNNDTYYYQKNYQNDITGIYDSNYNLIVKYTYDAWGKVLSVTDNNDNIITDNNHIGIISPFRYRSYYYDEETKLYYLNTRYYNPLWGRFINVDNYFKISLLGGNLFAYTENNAVTNLDTTGTFFKEIGKFFSDCYNNTKTFVAEKYNDIKKSASTATKNTTNYLKENFVV